MSDNIDGASAGDTGHTPGAKVTEGSYPELRLVKAEFFKSKKTPFGRCFKAHWEVLGDVNGYQSGALIEYFSKLEFNKHESYDKEECARTKQLLGALFGYTSVADIDANVKLSQHLLMVASEAQPMTGTVVSGELGYKGIFSKWTFAAVIDPTTGKSKIVRGKVAGAAPVTAPVTAPAPAVFAPPPVAPPAPAAPAIPPGWAVHPQAPTWLYELANPANMRQVG